MGLGAAHVLAIDVGTSAIKVGAFREDGALAVSGTREQPITLTEGRAEQSPEETWGLVCEAVREVASSLEGAPLEAIAVSGQRGSVVTLDQAGRPIGDLIVWMDARGAPLTHWLEQTVGAHRYYATCGHPIVPYTGVTKLLWLQRHAPERFERSASVGSPQTLLLRQLGCEENVCDHSLGTYLFPFDLPERRWSQALAAEVGFPLEKLPRLVRAIDVVGALSREAAEDLGLPAGVPLVAGGGDGQCAGVGSGITRPGLAMVNVGTAAGVLSYLPSPTLDPAEALNCSAYVMPDAWEMEGHTQASGAVLRWLRDELQPGAGFEDVIERIEHVPPGTEGLLFLPTFNGSSAPRVDPKARGCLLGLTLTHTFGHVVRAALEGVSLELRWMLDAMEDVGVTVDEVRLTGGGARSARWNQIHADAIGRPVATLAVTDAAMVGAAMCAAVAIGIHPDLSTAADAFVRVDTTVEPAPEAADLYSALSERYRRTFVLLSEAGGFSDSPDLDAIPRAARG